LDEIQLFKSQQKGLGMKGIILSGGKGTRLYPLTQGLSKQLLPVYNKPMIYYPLSTLMLAGIKDILIISSPDVLSIYKNMLMDGSQWGINLSYAAQPTPRGLADAFIIGKEFIHEEPVALILGDNIFYGSGMVNIIQEAATLQDGAVIFAYPVRNPEQFGIVEVDANWKAIRIEEKPKKPRSNLAVPGFYFYDNRVTGYAESLKPSSRGEIEITDLNKIYLEQKKLRVNFLGRGIAWLDMGTPESLLQAANYVQAVEERQGLMISCPEEVAYRMGFINADQLKTQIKKIKNTIYAEYLEKVLQEENFSF
jgi:glucose-1-phosphate thymidylyltransferase